MSAEKPAPNQNTKTSGSAEILQKPKPLNEFEVQYVISNLDRRLDVARSSRRAELDRETGGDGFSITGLLSVWYMERAYKFGWEQALHEQSGGKTETKTKDPRSTVTNIAIAIGVVLGAVLGALLFGLFLAGPLGLAGAIVIGAVAGSAVGGALGYADAFFENGKLKEQVEKAERDVVELSDKARGHTAQIEAKKEQENLRQNVQGLAEKVDKLAEKQEKTTERLSSVERLQQERESAKEGKGTGIV